MNQDRISYSFGFKLSIGQYETAHADITYSSDVKEGETKEKAFRRVVKFVEDRAAEKMDEVKEIKGGDSDS